MAEQWAGATHSTHSTHEMAYMPQVIYISLHPLRSNFLLFSPDFVQKLRCIE